LPAITAVVKPIPIDLRAYVPVGQTQVHILIYKTTNNGITTPYLNKVVDVATALEDIGIGTVEYQIYIVPDGGGEPRYIASEKVVFTE
jgi:hypothetical protein